MRSIWKGNINFGMVSIPAKLYTATEDGRVAFHQYHKGCGGRIKMPRKCFECGKEELEASEIEKGYEISSTQHIILEEADFQSLPLKSLKQIEVVEFTDVASIDVRAYSSCYFLSCEDAGLKPFILFVKAMEAANLMGIAKLTYREREHLAAIRPYNELMLLHTLHYADELRPYEDLKPRQMALISEKEQEMAITLVKAMAAGKFELAKYHNDYREALERMIEAKLSGGAIPTAEPGQPPISDVAEALIASLNLKGVKVPV